MGDSDTRRQPAATQTEVLFYHLERQPLERVLPGLLEKTLARGWRAVVQSDSEERLEALDTALWTYSEASFLPHGTKRDGLAAEQPVYLTTGDETPNGAGVRFLVDGASVASYEGFVRVVHIFDGRDEESKARARGAWQAAKSQGFPVTYWRQGDSGRWEKVGA
jgi:DNA polymerase-3 subunit chi